MVKRRAEGSGGGLRGQGEGLGVKKRAEGSGGGLRGQGEG